ncbi:MULTISPECIES: trypsin-like peptidase domain-containing protein [Prochlorococcus]|uniref:trypsin-like peptidase domain-containing protein n=1 Tax=Prochlorococcus TaxID=1218 RepID=UPI0005339133|nr:MULTISPECIES: trypsin-like peptidase domain-containing protein [Prochlorococcus]KGG13288.1 putative serine protease [Prochlorococcus sp. MIT 0601]
MKIAQLIYNSGLCGLLLGISAYYVKSSPNLHSPYLTESSRSLVPGKSFVTEAVNQSGPAVVTIETQRKITVRQYIFPKNFFVDPNLEKFFNPPNSQSPKHHVQKSQGSGVIFSEDGLVLTNAHVVENTDKLIIGLSDGKRFPAEIIGQDYLTDLAVVRIQGKGPWPIALLGNSDKLVVGDWAIAVGNPFGLEKTVTLGIISNLNRNVSQLGISDKRLKLIQTDAAINPGNSGGPLLNSAGEVIGINTLVRTGPGAGLGFAIPINQAIEIANQLINTGKAIHPMIGINLSNVQSKNEKKFNAGVRVARVIPNSPAEKAGFKLNDIVISINGLMVNNAEEVINEISNNGIEKRVTFKIFRNGKNIKILVRPIDMSLFEIN